MQSRFAVCACFIVGLGGAAVSNAGAPTLTKAWTADGFANPESVALSPDRKYFFVSNVAGEGDARDGNGFISKVSMDGAIIEREWVKGLDGPKGLAVDGDRLFVSDITALVEIDVRSGAVKARHAAAGAGFLNDVAVAPGHGVLVSDSAKARIYGWHDDHMTTWLEHELLASINGLLPEADRLVVTTMQGKLLAIDWDTRKITVLAEDLGNADGLVALGSGDYLVGEWPGRLFHVAKDGKSSVLLDTRDSKHYYNDFILVGNRLVVPNWEPSSVTAYQIRRPAR